MRAQCIVGHDGLGHQVGALGLDARVDVAAVPAVRPAIEAALLHRGQVVGHQVAAEFVAFVDDRPERAAHRLPGHAVGVAQARREQSHRTAGAVDFPDGRAAFLGRHAVLGHIAVGAHGGVELAAVEAGDQRLGPVVVQRTARQVGQLAATGGNAQIALVVGVLPNRIGVRHVQEVAHQRHTEGRVQLVEEHCARLGFAIAVEVAQQRDAVGARRAGTGALHDLLHHEALDALARLGPGWCIRFGHQHVPVGQDVQPARMVQARDEGLHLQRACRSGHCTGGPAHGGRNVDGRQCRGRGRGQGRLRPRVGQVGQFGRLAAGAQQAGAAQGCQRQNDGARDRREGHQAAAPCGGQPQHLHWSKSHARGIRESRSPQSPANKFSRCSGSIGLTKCWSSPAWRERSRSAAWPQPVRATSITSLNSGCARMRREAS